MRQSTYLSNFYNGDYKQLVIKEINNLFTITNSELVEQSFSLDESLCSDTQVVYGSCESSCIRFQTTDLTSALKGKIVDVFIYFNSLSANSFKVGRYKIDTVTVTSDKTRRDVVAYDIMYDVLNADLTDWYENYNFSNNVTLKQFRDSFFDEVGVTQETTTLVNDNMVLQKTVSATYISGKDIITAICELNGVFGHINADSEFVYKKYTGTSVGTITPDKYTGVDYESYSVDQIDSVSIRQIENDIGVTVGTTFANTLIIENNILTFGINETQAQTIGNNILNNVKNAVTRIPFSLSAVGCLCYEVGDVITIKLNDNSTFKSIIMNRTLNGITAMWDSYRLDDTQKREERVNSIESEYERLRGKYMAIDKSIEGINVTIGDENNGLIHDINVTSNGLSSEITQREELGDRVTNVEVSTSGLSARLTAVEKEVDGEYVSYEVTEEPNLNAYGTNKPNYPSWDWTRSIPVLEDNPITLGSGIYFEYTDEDYKRNIRSLAFDMANALSYRFVLTDGVYKWNQIADTEYSVLVEKIAEIKITTDGLTSSVSALTTEVDKKADTTTVLSEISSAIEQSESSIMGQVAGTYYTKESADSDWDREERTSKISLSLDGYTTEVLDRKYVGDDTEYRQMQSTVNQTASSVNGKVWERGGSESSNSFSYELTSTQFRLTSNGSEKFKCDKNGITIHGNGDFTGQINATSGYIGSSATNGFTIKSSYIANGKSSLTDSNAGVYIGKNGISLGASSVFSVTSSGVLTAKSGTIGGWEIQSSYLRKNSADATAVDGVQYQSYLGSSASSGNSAFLVRKHKATAIASDGTVTYGDWENMFQVTYGGKLTATNVDISGKITATSGSFAGEIKATSGFIGSSKTNGFTITSDAIYNGTNSYSSTTSGLYLSTSGMRIVGKDSSNRTNYTNIDENGIDCSYANFTNLFCNSSSTKYANVNGTTGFYVKNGSDNSTLSGGALSLKSSTNGSCSIDGRLIELKNTSSTYTGTVGISSDSIKFTPSTSTSSSAEKTFSILCGSTTMVEISKNSTVLGNSGTSAQIGFFGLSGSTRQSISKIGSTSTARTLEKTIDKLNDLIDALADYGLIKNY